MPIKPLHAPAAAPQRATFDADGWSARWQAQLTAAKEAQANPAALMLQSKALVDELVAVDSVDKIKLFLDPLANVFDAQFAEQFVAARVGKSVHEVHLNLGAALERTLNKGSLSLKKVSDFSNAKPLVTSSGKRVGTLVFSPIQEVFAHVSAVPSHVSSDVARGGGPVGGIELGWRQVAEKSGNATFIDATTRFPFERDKAGAVHSGTYETGNVHPDHGPIRLAYGPTVPQRALRFNSTTDLADAALTAQREAHQLEMTARMFKVSLAELADIHAQGLAGVTPFTAENPGIISMPIFCTGPDRAVSVPDAAKGDRRVFDPESPIYKQIMNELKAEGVFVPPFEVVTCFFNPHPGSGHEVNDEMNKYVANFAGQNNVTQDYKDAKTRFGEYAASVSAGPVGKPLEPYVNRKFDEFANDFSQLLRLLPKEATDHAGANPGFFATHFQSMGNQAVDMAFQLAKFASIPDLLDKFGVPNADQLGNVDRMSRLLASASFRDAVREEITLHPTFKGARGGDGISKDDDLRFGGVIALGIESLMQGARWKHLDAFYDTYQAEMAKVSESVGAAAGGLQGLGTLGALQARLAMLTTDNGKLEEQTEQLIKELNAALGGKASAEAAKSELATELAKEIAAHKKTKIGAADAPDLRAQLKSLRDQLQVQAELVQTYKAKAEAKVAYARSAPSISTSSY